MFLLKTKFVISAPNKASWPKDELNEICFLGKSNVGKSSLLNALCNNSKLARVSKTPGCTKLLNFFDVDGKYRIVDAPGYGYAKTSLLDDKSFAKMMDEYIYERKNAKLFVLLLDTRREISKDDLSCINILQEANREMIIVGTKADKINQSEKSKFLKNVKNVTGSKVFLTSSVNRKNIDELVQYLDEVGKNY